MDWRPNLVLDTGWVVDNGSASTSQGSWSSHVYDTTVTEGGYSSWGNASNGGGGYGSGGGGGGGPVEYVGDMFSGGSGSGSGGMMMMAMEGDSASAVLEAEAVAVEEGALAGQDAVLATI